MSRGGSASTLMRFRTRKHELLPWWDFPLCGVQKQMFPSHPLLLSLFSDLVLFLNISSSLWLFHTRPHTLSLISSLHLHIQGLRPRQGCVESVKWLRLCLCSVCVCVTINITSDFQRICQDKQLRACQCYTTIPLGPNNMRYYFSVSRDVYLGHTIWSIHHSLTIKLLSKYFRVSLMCHNDIFWSCYMHALFTPHPCTKLFPSCLLLYLCVSLISTQSDCCTIIPCCHPTSSLMADGEEG